MHNLFTTIKAAQLLARKERSGAAASILTTLLSEIENIGKQARREPTDAEVVAVIQKFTKNIDEVIKLTAAGSKDNDLAIYEKQIIAMYLPVQLTEADLTKIIAGLKQSLPEPSVGAIMKALKENYAGQYEGQLASKLVKQLA